MSAGEALIAAVVAFCLLGYAMLTKAFWIIVLLVWGIVSTGYCIWWLWLFFSTVSNIQ